MHNSTGVITASDFEVLCRHKDFLGTKLSFVELATGAPNKKTGKGGKAWGGGFRGRPALTRQLLPVLSDLHGAVKPVQFGSRIAAFRGFWRFLDELESVGGIAPIDSLSDLGVAHGVLWIRKYAPPYTTYFLARQACELAREMHGLTPLGWPSMRFPRKPAADVATPEQAQIIYIALKHRVYAAFDKWRVADELASKGRNLLEIPVEERPTPSVTAADLHTTYRALILKSGDALPTAAELLGELGYRSRFDGGGIRGVSTTYKNSGTGIRDLIDGLYPSSRTLQDIFHLFLIQTGWNPQVLLDIDPSDAAWATRIGDPHANIYRISSFKVRAGSWQRTISRGKPSHSPYQLIKRLWEKTEPLRNGVANGQLPSSLPGLVRRSPWLFAVYDADMSVGLLDEQSYAQGGYLRKLCKEINLSARERHARSSAGAAAVSSSESAVSIVPDNIKPSDFRDIYIGNEFLQSGYNFVIAMLAGNHSSMRTTRRYLRSRSYRAHGENELRKLMDHLWGETETLRAVDPAILRALCERGVVSESQRDRWLRGKDRTYLGMGCLSPMTPPPAIDPTNDGTQCCRNQHLCVLCRHGIVFPDSLTDLTKRLAEVRALRSRMPMTAWARATMLQAEMEGLIGTIAQFSQAEATSLEEFWRLEIEAGRHIVLEWDGMHVES